MASKDSPDAERVKRLQEERQLRVHLDKIEDAERDVKFLNMMITVGSIVLITDVAAMFISNTNWFIVMFGIGPAYVVNILGGFLIMGMIGIAIAYSMSRSDSAGYGSGRSETNPYKQLRNVKREYRNFISDGTDF